VQHRQTYSPEELEAEKKFRKKASVYRHVFSGPQGVTVLVDILNDLHYYDTERADEETAILKRAANGILAKMGILQPENMWLIVEALEKVPTPPEKENK